MNSSDSFSKLSSCESTSAAINNRKNQDKKKKKIKGSGAAATKLSTDPQSVAARQRRHRISDRFKILQSLVPGGSKMDTVSMLEEAIQYVQFLKTQIWIHQAMISLVDNTDHHDPNISYSSAVLPNFHHDQMFDLYCSNYSGNEPQAEMSTLLGSQECSWPFQGEEIGPFDAYMHN
ncbi:hypothetical protein BUALT_Bualt11G0132100 [Buddleja alternifolia]|uniref:BHLH domain-containing protein n=1 Tax=Buddleja alternifolia TaxID=168488 RepID=A0AAV6X5E7_9LAMI|nr:hypothetical protein BUALT_Bualt11G0132100 [Buddleja alternifolia]